MQVNILLPHQVFAKLTDVSSLVIDTPKGSFGILPHRLDCITPLVAGILSYQTQNQEFHYIAIDEGIFVKTGEQVMISVRRAIKGNTLDELKQTVEREFLNLDQEQQELRNVLAKLESGFLKQFSALEKE
jgi:F-type H+-transporting ATPase subunit epsilon